MSEADLLQQIEDLKAELRKSRVERTRLKRQVDELSRENKDLRILNSEYTQMIVNKPVTRSALQKTINLQADQIAGLQHDLEVLRITSQYSKPDDKCVSDLESKLKALEAENSTLREELQKYTFTEEQLKPAKRGRPRTIPDGIREQVKDLHEQGCSVRKIAELLGVSVGFTQKTIKQTV